MIKGLILIVGGDNTGGIERFVSNILPLLKKNNIDVELLRTLSSGGYYGGIYDQFSKTQVGPLPQKRNFFKSIFLYYKILKSFESDLILSFDYWQAAEQSIAAFLTRKKILVSYRNTIPTNKIRAKIRSIISNLFSSVYIANSESVLKYMKNELFLNPNKAINLGNGIKLDKYLLTKSNSKNTNKLVIGTVARLMPIKDHFKIIEIAKIAMANDKNWKFVWTGEGPLRDKYEEIITENNLGSYIEIQGFVDSSNGLFSGFDIFLLTSKNEGLSQALVEACAAEVAIIAADVPGICDVINNSENGILVKQDDILGYYNSIEYLEQNPKIARKLAQTARETAISRFSLESVFNEYLSVLNRVYAQKKK